MTINVTKDNILPVLHTVLLLAIFGLSLWSQPWNQSSSSNARTIVVTGEGKVKAEPDEYVFSPYFQRTGSDKKALQDELTELANTAVAGLKEIGIEESDIKLDASSYDQWFYNEGEEGVLSISLTITLDDDSKVQEVQDYLLSLEAEGQITPQATFSNAKQAELEAEATKIASEDARKKAEAQAAQFSAKLGKVVKIENTGGDFGVYPVMMSAPSSEARDAQAAPSLPVLSGENEVTLQVSATYEIE